MKTILGLVPQAMRILYADSRRIKIQKPLIKPLFQKEISALVVEGRDHHDE